jgi:S-adenosylmethionine:tRNA ribosyltransferase-isomerase
LSRFEIFDEAVKSLRLSDFTYDYPEELIAQYPAKKRDESRLMVLNRVGEIIEHKKFPDVIHYMSAGDCLVVNETKVFPARLMGFKDRTDAQVEVFLLRELERKIWEVMVKPARKVRIGNKISFDHDLICDVIDNTVSGGRVVRFNMDGDEFFSTIEKIGKSPIPPYIRRDSEEIDKIRYQTVYARRRGAVAAPTAGLHFTSDLLERIKKKSVIVVPIVLHIGLGTFRPVMVEDLARHQMDSEYYEISPGVADIINKVKKSGHKVIAVGTSTVRALESACLGGREVKPKKAWTDKFIYPPYTFCVVDRLITNFHQPRSTLLMLVSAFSNRDFIVMAYQEAIRQKYRLFSYGDAMIIL